MGQKGDFFNFFRLSKRVPTLGVFLVTSFVCLGSLITQLAAAQDPEPEGPARDNIVGAEENILPDVEAVERATPPELVLGDPMVSNPICPEDATVTLEFTVNNVFGEVFARGAMETDELIYTSRAIDPVYEDQTYRARFEFLVPSNTPDREFEIGAYVVLSTPQGVELELVEYSYVSLEDGPGDCSAQATVSLGDPIVSGPACPDPVRVTIPYTVDANFDIETMGFVATSEAFPGRIAEPLFRTRGKIELLLPRTSESGEWQVTLEVGGLTFDSTAGSATTTFEVEASSNDCSPGQPQITVGTPVVLNESCPEAIEVEIPFRIEAPNGAAELLVEGHSVAFPEEAYDIKSFEGGNPIEEGTFTLRLPPTTETGIWHVSLVARDLVRETAVADVRFEVKGNKGCAPTLELRTATLSGPVCPSDATLSVEFAVDNALAEILILELTATDPAGVEYTEYFSEVPEFFGGSGDYGNSTEFIRDEQHVRGTLRMELPANARPGVWELQATGSVSVIAENRYEVADTTSFEVKSGGGQCTYAVPQKVTINQLSVSGPFCSDDAEITVAVSASAERGVEALHVSGTLGDALDSISGSTPEGYDFQQAQKVDYLFTIPIPPDQQPGLYLFEASMHDTAGVFTTSDRAFLELERASDCPTDDPHLVVDELVICPAEYSIEAKVSAEDDGGLERLGLAVRRVDSASDDEVGIDLSGEKSHAEVLEVEIPAEYLLYEDLLTAEVTARDVDGNESSFVRYFEARGGDGACMSFSSRPTPVVTPTPTPTSTPAAVATPTPEPQAPAMTYWEDGYSPNSFVAAVSGPEPPNAATPTPAKQASPSNEVPAKIAFTGASTGYPAVVGLFLFGIGMVAFGRGRIRSRS